MDLFKKNQKITPTQASKEEFAKELSAKLKKSNNDNDKDMFSEVLTKISIP